MILSKHDNDLYTNKIIYIYSNTSSTIVKFKRLVVIFHCFFYHYKKKNIVSMVGLHLFKWTSVYVCMYIHLFLYMCVYICASHRLCFTFEGLILHQILILFVFNKEIYLTVYLCKKGTQLRASHSVCIYFFIKSMKITRFKKCLTLSWSPQQPI